MCVHMLVEGVGSLGARVRSDCDQAATYGGRQLTTTVFARAVHPLNRRAVAPALNPVNILQKPQISIS